MIQTLQSSRRRLALLTIGAVAALACSPAPAQAANAPELTRDSRAALAQLYAGNPKAKALGAGAKGILVFPKITKAGAIVGGQRGDGAMLVGNQVKGFYRITAASYGLQLGVQQFGYVLFLMSDKAIADVNRSDGWAIGSSPSLVIVDKGAAKTMNTSTLSKDVYAMPFDQHGLMAGTGLEGSKITQIYPDA